jgi:hypothetical protein
VFPVPRRDTYTTGIAPYNTQSGNLAALVMRANHHRHRAYNTQSGNHGGSAEIHPINRLYRKDHGERI